ncbi:hypothetical protein D9M68_203040 [compost metagenome]
MWRTRMRKDGIHDTSATYTMLAKKKISMVLRNTSERSSVLNAALPACFGRRGGRLTANHSTTATRIPNRPKTW